MIRTRLKRTSRIESEKMRKRHKTKQALLMQQKAAAASTRTQAQIDDYVLNVRPSRLREMAREGFFENEAEDVDLATDDPDELVLLEAAEREEGQGFVVDDDDSE
tara:strand:+ start:309 stop:623 length:315 start_codon:yes stop_codon:yes gene_type:complete